MNLRLSGIINFYSFPTTKNTKGEFIKFSTWLTSYSMHSENWRLIYIYPWTLIKFPHIIHQTCNTDALFQALWTLLLDMAPKQNQTMKSRELKSSNYKMHVHSRFLPVKHFEFTSLLHYCRDMCLNHYTVNLFQMYFSTPH